MVREFDTHSDSLDAARQLGVLSPLARHGT